LRPANPKTSEAPFTRFKRCVRHRARAGELLAPGGGEISTRQQTHIKTKVQKASGFRKNSTHIGAARRATPVFVRTFATSRLVPLTR